MLCGPPERVAVLKTATPPLRLRLPIVIPSDMNVTVPPGVPAPEVTVAVNVTDCPTPEGFSELARVVVVPALVTVSGSSADVLLAKVASPGYVALIGSVPALSDEVVKLAAPLASVPVPSTVAPCVNVMFSPSGGKTAVELRATLKVTGCPNVDGLLEDVRFIVTAALTTSTTVFDVLPVNVMSPEYTAEIFELPTGSAVVE